MQAIISMFSVTPTLNVHSRLGPLHFALSQNRFRVCRQEFSISMNLSEERFSPLTWLSDREGHLKNPNGYADSTSTVGFSFYPVEWVPSYCCI